jgi:glucosamine--fructose-6-phosphate aminotransferase (isomerizing)
MINSILGILDDKDVMPTLLEGLQRLELEYGDYDWVGIATLENGRIRHLQTQGNMQNLQHRLQQQPMAGNLGIAYLHKTVPGEPDIPRSSLYVSEQVAIISNGIVKNADDIREYLLKLGYEFFGTTTEEVILRMILRYLEIGSLPEEAVLVTVARLRGEFSILALFAQPANRLIATRHDSPLAIGTNKNLFYLSSEFKTLDVLCHRIIELEGGKPIVLRSSNKGITNL